jgi:hypothetical protein
MLMVCHHLTRRSRRTSPSPSRASARRPSPPRTSCTTSAPSHDRLGLPGHGPGRRGHLPHLADRAQDEGAARRLAGADGGARQLPRQALHRQVHHQPGHHPRHRHEVGSVEVGKLADLVLWKPAFFGTKPSLILKGGMIAAAPMGDPNASIPTPQPVHYRPMFGAFGKACRATGELRQRRGPRRGISAASSVSSAPGRRARLPQRRKADMRLNDYQPAMEVDPQTYEVRADGELLTCEPATVLPMAQRYFLFSGSCRAAACSATAMRWCVEQPDYPGSRRQRDADRGEQRRSAAAAARRLSPRQPSREPADPARAPAFPRDHVLEEMLEGLGLNVAAVDDAFNPESGAYAVHGHGHG